MNLGKPHCSEGTVSDNVTDVVMSSLKTCNMNCGSRLEGREQGVGSQSPTRRVWMGIRTTITKKGISK